LTSTEERPKPYAHSRKRHFINPEKRWMYQELLPALGTKSPSEEKSVLADGYVLESSVDGDEIILSHADFCQ
jgi:hypothetical protein